jgi:hypothetical protein
MANERPLLPLALLGAAFGGATLLLLIGVATKSGAYVPDASAPPEPPEASELDAIPLATATMDATPAPPATASATAVATSTVTIAAEDAGGDASHDGGKRKPHHR